MIIDAAISPICTIRTLSSIKRRLFMNLAAIRHPVPAASLSKGVDPESIDSVRRFVRGNQFPSSSRGCFLFAYMDEEDRFATVHLRHGLAGHRQPPAFVRCAAPGSGVLHLLELRTPPVHRIEYRLELTDRDEQSSTAIDPLNPNTVRDPFAHKSVVSTADYRAPAYATDDPHAPRGTLRDVVLEGPIGKPWHTWIWSPPNRSDAERLPVVLFLDGGDWLHLNHANTILDNLVHQRAIAPCRAVFVKPASRNEEYAANPTTAAYLADGLPRMLAEFMPWPRLSRRRFAVGCSLGGLCLLHAHFSQPSAFGGLVLQSGSFFQPHTDAMEAGFTYFPQITNFVSRTLGSIGRRIPRIPLHMTCGLGEENNVNNHIMAEALRRQGFPLTFHEQPDAHNWTCWRDSIGSGLVRLLGQ